ncbi:DMT family transporter [soil metagenome]
MATTDNKMIAMLCACAAVGLAASGDAIAKSMSGTYPVHEALIIRCIVSAPIIYLIGRRQTPRLDMLPRGSGLSFLRGAILCTAYMAFILSIAAMPMANVVAIYFVMPLVVAAGACVVLAERVGLNRWIAVIVGFAGVTIMLKPDTDSVFEPAAFLALFSAIAYAFGQMLGRRVARLVDPVVMAFQANLVYLAAAAVLAIFFNMFDFSFVQHKSLLFLVRPWTIPTVLDFVLMSFLGALAAGAMVLFGTAYKAAESSFVAPFEYTAMFWATLYGYVIFGDELGLRTIAGGGIVIAAGLFMIWSDRYFVRKATAGI